MPRNFSVKLGSIGDKGSGGFSWGVTLPLPGVSVIPPGATVAQIAASLNLGGLALTETFDNFDVATEFFAIFVDLWVLSGGNPEDGTYPFNNLPAGFRVTAASLTASISGGPWSSAILTALGSGNSNVLTNPGLLTYTYNALPSAFQLAFEKLGVTFIPPVAPHASNLVAQVNFISLSGTYILGQSTITTPVFTPTIQNINPVFVGDKIKITSNLKGLDGVKKIKLVFGPKTITLEWPNFYWWFVFLIEEFELDFYVPWGFGTYSGPVQVFIEGTTFSGSVLAGTFNILYADGSGIYTFVKGQTDDVLYFRQGTTTDIRFLMLPGLSILSDETYEEDFYSMLQYPAKVLSRDDPDEDFDSDEFYKDFAVVGVSRIVVVTKTVEIPSPFIATAYIP